jgi:hypothetical protein
MTEYAEYCDTREDLLSCWKERGGYALDLGGCNFWWAWDLDNALSIVGDAWGLDMEDVRSVLLDPLAETHVLDRAKALQILDTGPSFARPDLTVKQ